MDIRVKRIYDHTDPEDGFRILVDRLWPRGLSKQDARVDSWMKSIAPSNELRKWYNHDPEKWTEFKERYYTELAENSEAITELLAHIKHGRVSLLYSSKEQNLNNAIALRDYISSVSKRKY